MATLTVSTTTNFSAQNLIDIDLIDFTNIFTAATATFVASQFDDFQILNSVAIDGSTGINHITVNGGSLDASGWTFSSWSAVDGITLNGTGGADTIIGSIQSETINGNAGADTFGGSLGADVLNGGADVDTVTYAASAAVTVNLAAGTGSGGHAAGDTYGGIENIVGSAFADTITGNTEINSLQGGNGNDTLDGAGNNDILEGGDGADTLIGGSGDDVFLYTNPAHSDAGESVDGGIGADDRIRSATSGLLDLTGATINGVETLEFVTGNCRFNGSALGTVSGIVNIIGTGSNNILQLVAGASVNLASLTFTNWDPSALISIIGGGSGSNNIVGSSQRDEINTSGGADLLFSGEGDDTFQIASSTDIVAGMTINGGLGTLDTVKTFTTGLHDFSLMTLQGVERLDFFSGSGSARFSATQIGVGGVTLVDGSGLAADSLFVSGVAVDLSSVLFSSWNPAAVIQIDGTSGADSLIGSSQNETINGKGGADIMRGGAGNDNYVVDNVGDVADESIAGSGGKDGVFSSTISINLADAVHFKGTIENAVLTGAANLNLTGNGLTNILVGNTGNNTLNGGAGADFMRGGAGKDNYFVDNAGDIVDESFAGSAGADGVFSSVISINLADSGHFRGDLESLGLTGSANINGFGNSLNNFILGNSGVNVLNGGLGADTMTGGAGNDVFRFDSALGGTNIDSIADYTVVNDQIQIDNAVFTGLANGALAAAAFFTGTAAHDADDRIIYDSATGKVFFDADGTGATAQIQFATLSAGLAMVAGEFTVI